MNKVLSLQQETVSKEVQLKAKSSKSQNCKSIVVTQVGFSVKD
jgi:hypothetical protein